VFSLKELLLVKITCGKPWYSSRKSHKNVKLAHFYTAFWVHSFVANLSFYLDFLNECPKMGFVVVKIAK